VFQKHIQIYLLLLKSLHWLEHVHKFSCLTSKQATIKIWLREGPPYKKGEGACGKFWKEPLRGTKILLCGPGLKFCSPLRGINWQHFFFSQLVRRQNSINPVIWLVQRVGRIFPSRPLQQVESIALIYFCERISGIHQSFTFFTLPLMINQRKFVSI